MGLKRLFFLITRNTCKICLYLSLSERVIDLLISTVHPCLLYTIEAIHSLNEHNITKLKFYKTDVRNVQEI